MTQQRVRYSYGTVTAVLSLPQTLVCHDGQSNSIIATAQYDSPAVGDRVLILTIGRTIYLQGTLT